MSAADESESLLDHLTERINPKDWRVSSNRTRHPDPGADELKTLIQIMQKERRSPDRLKVDEKDPTEAA
jgi:hypothetical protein